MTTKSSNGLLRMHMGSQVQQSVGVTPFIIIPSQDLEELEEVSKRLSVLILNYVPEGSTPYTRGHR